MSHNNVINEKKKALLAYKEKILEEIKYCERSIDEFLTNHKSNSFYDENTDSSDSEEDFPNTMDPGPSIIKLKLQQSNMSTCLQATQELTGLIVLQSEVSVLAEEPKFEGERPITEDGMWQEVTAECTIDLVQFTINFFMHTPSRKFAPTSYRGLRVVPVKSVNELELAPSVLQTVKLPSDAIEVLKSYAAGYRSRRTTLARLAKKYESQLTMEPHAEGGFVLRCADLLEVSWKLENKWSPVAPFHHRMKFDLEYMDESYIKTISQAYKEILDPAIQTDERTLLLAKIISTCLEARGPVDPESDLDSKTTDRDTDIEKRDSESERRDSEVMAPPKSLPKLKKKSSLPNPAQKRSINEDDRDNAAKKMRNSDIPNAEPTNSGDGKRKHAINDMVDEGVKKRKINEGDAKKKVASNKNSKETTDINQPKNVNDIGNTENKDTNVKNVKTKAKTGKETDNIQSKANKDGKESGTKNKNPVSAKTKIVKETGDIGAKTKSKNVIDTVDTDAKDNNTNTKTKNINASDKNKNVKAGNNVKNDNIKEANTNIQSKTNIVKEPSNIGKISNSEPKKSIVKEGGNPEKNVNTKKNPKKVANVESKENVDTNRITENVTSKDAERKTKVTEKNINIAKTKNAAVNQNIPKPVTKSKKNDVDKPKNDQGDLKGSEKKTKSHKLILELVTNTAKNLKEIPNVKSNTVKKVVEKHATNKIKDKISPINKVINKGTNIGKETASDVITSQNLFAKKNKEIVITKNVTKEPIKKMSHQIASHRTALKVQNLQKSLKPGNTKILSTGNIEKENGAKVSKIPQKKLSPVSEGSSKKHFLRISPRKLPSKSKSSQLNTFKQVIVKCTNIPRLLKKPAPKTIH